MKEHEKRIRALLDYHANSEFALVAADKADLRALLADLDMDRYENSLRKEIVASGNQLVKKLEADLDAMRVKAARYDYLSERFVGADFDWNESGLQTLVFKVEPGTQVWATADKTIDGAIDALKGAEA